MSGAVCGTGTGTSIGIGNGNDTLEMKIFNSEDELRRKRWKNG